MTRPTGAPAGNTTAPNSSLAPSTTSAPVTTAPPPTSATTTSTAVSTTVALDPMEPRLVSTVNGCVHTIEIDGSGNVWAGCDNAIYRRQGDQWLRIPVPEDALDFAVAGDGTLVAVAWRGPWNDPTFWLATWNGDAWDMVEVESAYAVASAPNGSVWAATREPAQVFRDGQWNTVAGTIGSEPGAGDDVILGGPAWLDVAVDATGGVWLSHEHGGTVFRWDGSLTRVGAGFEQIWAAPDGRLWARGAAEAHGVWAVFTYGNGRWTSVTGLEGIYATDVAFDGDNGVWVATDGDGLLYGDGTTWTAIGDDSGVPSTVWSVAIDGDDVWVGTASGLVRIDRSN
jgi:hypothetical protein